MCFIWRSVIATAGIPSSTRTTTSAGRSPRTANGSSCTRTARLTDAGPLRGSSPGDGEVVDAQGRGIDAGFEFEVVGGPILAADGVADALSCSLPHGKIREKKSNRA